MIKFLGLSFLLYTVRAANVLERLAVQDGAICDDRIPAYMVAEGHKLAGAENKVVLKDVEEQECKNMCTDNKDDQGNQVMCSSYTYNIKEKTCSIHRGKAMPVGKLELKPAPGHRYYEKFCLPEGTPADCGEAPFFRADQAVLVGFAKNVSHTKHLSVCIQACIEMSAECRSAMFFGAAGECILSVASAQDAPDVFAEEVDEENVVYFENGCVLENQIRAQKIQSRGHETKKPVETKKPQPTTHLANATTEAKKPIDKSKPMSEEKKMTSKEEKEKEMEKEKENDETEEPEEPKQPLLLTTKLSLHSVLLQMTPTCSLEVKMVW
jgi:hypothetical protein